MSDAPTITQEILTPYLSSQAKILVFITSIIGGLSFSRLNHNNGWELLHGAQRSAFKLMVQKYLALVVVCLLFITPALLATVSLIIVSLNPWLQVVILMLGLVLLMLWMLALTMMLSSFVKNSGFAILLSLIVLMTLLLITQSSLGDEWGKNWLQLFSPFFHFIQLSKNRIPITSIYYFLFGIIMFLWIAKIRIVHKRHTL